ncbi:ATP-binding protein [Roseomonas marmotae]|uniref:Winged helix-turn-helix domain-containing protein n=1 Tax=Roseomonas marmotae TaxID=2768161 RepID=A0ABS3K8D1_9PROT|nr:winged helix-turn-helix domain-containing protein [Roseomonas marmotae]MBO1073718.1 winged helix-turn-helix domain-containing protein [Roseomonas marmotae]QTI78647.1 winged helix-turn-helix domain-containing protein [Roseomonas marmotae]
MFDVAKAFAFGPYRLVPERRILAAEGREVPIRGRAFDLLLALVERRDRVVSKDELLDLVWPGRVVEEGNLTVHIAALRKLLGSGIIATLSGRGYRFVASVAEVPAESPRHPGPTPPPAPADTGEAGEAGSWRGDLPRPLTKLIGRDADLEQVEARLRETRLVTVVGAGGVGKTRLALAVADRACQGYLDGVWLADLGPVEDSRLVMATIGSALGIDIGGGEVLRVVVSWLACRRGLLVLDGCEHLLHAAADAAEAVLRSCPGITILSTSREPLRAEGEGLHRLQPLDAAAPEVAITADRLGDYPASELFIERARAVLGRFVPGDADAREIMEICRRLDGIPLAIELAAPALQALTLTELRERLERRFGLLTAGRRTALARQQTLRATIGWSLDLLEPTERMLLLRLSAFAGNWTSESASFVVGGALGEDEVCGLIATLVDKSLVQADLAGVQARYRLLDSTRYYAAERLSASDLVEVRGRLVRWLAKAYERAEADWPFMADDDWFALYAPEIENLRTSLAWAFGPNGDERLGVELASLTEHVWGELSLTSELHDWFDLAISRINEGTPPDVAGRLWLGRCGWLAPGGVQALDASRRAVALLRAAGSRIDLGRALWRQAWQHIVTGALAAAAPLLEEAGGLLREGRESKALVSWLRVRAVARSRGGEPDAARADLEEALSMARRLRSPRDIALTLGGIAEVQFAAGRVSEAVAVAQEALASLGPVRVRSAWVQHIGGAIASYLLAEGDIARARPIVAERLAAARIMGLQHEVTVNLESLGLIAAAEGNLATAGRLFGYVRSCHAQRGTVRSAGSQAVHERFLALLCQRLAPGELDLLAAQGASLLEEEIVAEAFAVALHL